MIFARGIWPRHDFPCLEVFMLRQEGKVLKQIGKWSIQEWFYYCIVFFDVLECTLFWLCGRCWQWLLTMSRYYHPSLATWQTFQAQNRKSLIFIWSLSGGSWMGFQLQTSKKRIKKGNLSNMTIFQIGGLLIISIDLSWFLYFRPPENKQPTHIIHPFVWCRPNTLSSAASRVTCLAIGQWLGG